METWTRHFQRLLGETEDTAADKEISSVLQNLNINNRPFTTRELARAKATVRVGKSPGLDGIYPLVLKNCDLGIIILGFCNLSLMHNQLHDMWCLSKIVPVAKSRDLSKPENYRGISICIQPHDI